MFKQNDNRAVLRLRVEAITPLLIRAGETGLNPGIADLSCVRTHHVERGPTVFIPGSSLKGVVRSAAEASIRNKVGNWEGACDPLGKASCGARLKELKKESGEDRSAKIHRAHCLACRTFGSTVLKGRVAIRDLLPFRDGQDDTDNFRHANRVESRHGVAINRISGAVQHGPFDLETVPPGAAFFGDVALENYQTWQLGLIAAAIDELNEGFAQLGSNKSRGLGLVKVRVLEILHEQTAGKKQPREVRDFLAPPEIDAYGLLPGASLPEAAEIEWGLRSRFSISGAATEEWMNAGRVALRKLMEGGCA
jgi:CRISPR-associated RAMP protein (TIGR02581 family)